MSREIKFRYLIKATLDNDFKFIVRSLEDLENDDNFGYGADIKARDQFTGLHDKNGKEIYEGDVLYWYGKYPYEVEWNYDLAWWNLPRNEDCYIRELEVIGNVWENPELLEEKK